LVVQVAERALLEDVKAFLVVEVAKFFPGNIQEPEFGALLNGTVSIVLGIIKTNETIANGALTFNETFVPFLANTTVDFTVIEMIPYDIHAPRPSRPVPIPQAPNATDTWFGFKVGSQGAAIAILITIILVPLVIIGAIVVFFLKQKTDTAFDEYEQL